MKNAKIHRSNKVIDTYRRASKRKWLFPVLYGVVLFGLVYVMQEYNLMLVERLTIISYYFYLITRK